MQYLTIYLFSIILGEWQMMNMITVQTNTTAILASLDWAADCIFLWAITVLALTAKDLEAILLKGPLQQIRKELEEKVNDKMFLFAIKCSRNMNSVFLSVEPVKTVLLIGKKGNNQLKVLLGSVANFSYYYFDSTNWLLS